mgnify:CR=1 FL=1
MDIDPFGNHAKALALRAQRNEVLASNIANTDTPGYKARDFDFRSAMQAAQTGTGGALPMNTTNAKHMSLTQGGAPGADPEIRYRVPQQPSVDGNTVEVVAARYGLVPVVVALPFPVESAGDITGRVLDAVGPRTGLVVLDLVTSPTALHLPVEQIVAAVGDVPVLVDAAHGPGMVDMSDGSLGDAAFVVANGHKWLCAPRGSAAMVVRTDWREQVRPLVVSYATSPAAEVYFSEGAPTEPPTGAVTEPGDVDVPCRRGLAVPAGDGAVV